MKRLKQMIIFIDVYCKDSREIIDEMNETNDITGRQILQR